MLSEQDRRFLKKRQQLSRLAPILWVFSGLLIAGHIAFWIWYPLLTNPFYVMAELENERLAATTIMAMAALTPVLGLMAWFLFLLAIVMAIVCVTLEKRYLAIVAQLLQEMAGNQPDEG